MDTYVAANLVSECVVPNVQLLHFECLFINIILHHNNHLATGNIYRPPAPTDSANCILSTINSLGKHHDIIILCDFKINWLGRSSFSDRNLFGSVNLTQSINEPTRVDYWCHHY